MDWIVKAACKGKTHLFFAPAGERAAAREARVAEALALCAVCPVRAECATMAETSNEGEAEEYGIWGGQALKA